MTAVLNPSSTKPSAFCYLSPAFLMSSVKGRQASTHLHHLLHHHLSIQHLHQFRTTTQTLGRPTWGVTASTRTLTAIR